MCYRGGCVLTSIGGTERRPPLCTPSALLPRLRRRSETLRNACRYTLFCGSFARHGSSVRGRRLRTGCANCWHETNAPPISCRKRRRKLGHQIDNGGQDDDD